MSNRSLPPSPFLPTLQASPYPTQDYQRVKQKFRRASINDVPPQSLPLLPPPPPPISSSLTREIIQLLVTTSTTLSISTRFPSCNWKNSLFYWLHNAISQN